MRWPAMNPYDGEWRRWYAWRPVRCGNVWAWLETVERAWDHDTNWTHGDLYEVPMGGYVYRVLSPTGGRQAGGRSGEAAMIAGDSTPQDSKSVAIRSLIPPREK